MLAQVVLLAAVGGIFLYFVSRKHNVRMQASKRIGFFFFLALNAYAVLFPSHTTWVAHQLGIGRGADLLLYLLVVAFVFGMLNTYLRFRGTTQQITELARALAIQEAERVNHQRGVLVEEQAPLPPTAAAIPNGRNGKNGNHVENGGHIRNGHGEDGASTPAGGSAQVPRIETPS